MGFKKITRILVGASAKRSAYHYFAHTADLSAFAGCSALPLNLLQSIIVHPIMKFTNQSRSCHPERSEGSLCPSSQTLRGVYPERSEGLRVTLVGNLCTLTKYSGHIVGADLSRTPPIYRPSR